MALYIFVPELRLSRDCHDTQGNTSLPELLDGTMKAGTIVYFFVVNASPLLSDCRQKRDHCPERDERRRHYWLLLHIAA